MKVYFLRRLLLVPITMVGVTFLVFLLTRAVPGGPMEQALAAGSMAGDSRASATGDRQGGVSEKEVEELEEEFGYDKPFFVAYLQWLGAVPRERLLAKKEFRQGGEDRIGSTGVTDPENETIVVLKGAGREVLVERSGLEVVSARYFSDGEPIAGDGWHVRVESPQMRRERWARRNNEAADKCPENYDFRAVVYKVRFEGLMQGDLGRSRIFGDPVTDLIKSRMPVAIYFGLLTFLITYGVFIPLGMVKAI